RAVREDDPLAHRRRGAQRALPLQRLGEEQRLHVRLARHHRVRRLEHLTEDQTADVVDRLARIELADRAENADAHDLRAIATFIHSDFPSWSKGGRILSAVGCWILDVGSWMLDLGCWDRGLRSKIQHLRPSLRS